MQRLTLGILAHVDAGKTTLSEAMLYRSGTIRKPGRVDNKDAFLDNYEVERARGITVFSKQAVIDYRDLQITLLDTPGHVDFSAEMERTLQVLDYAVLIVSGADGVQGHTETLWRLLERYHVPVFLFVNKMDQAGPCRDSLLGEMKSRLHDSCIPFDPEGTTDREAWLEELRVYLSENKAYVRDFIEHNLPDIKVVPSQATYLLWLDCTALGKTKEELEAMMAEAMQDMAEIEGLGELTEALTASVQVNMSPEDLERLKKKHRMDEMREIADADMKYLKAMFQKLEQERRSAGSTLPGSSSNSDHSGGSTVIRGISGMDGMTHEMAVAQSVMQAMNTPMATECANVDVSL